MSKLSLDALKTRAEASASSDLLSTISGGTENSCHDSSSTTVWTVDYTCSDNPCPSATPGVQLPSNFGFGDLIKLLSGVRF